MTDADIIATGTLEPRPGRSPEAAASLGLGIFAPGDVNGDGSADIVATELGYMVEQPFGSLLLVSGTPGTPQ